jgi:hypothetical protein
MALAVYKPRNPRKSPLFRLLEPLYDTVKGVWEERFESPYGFWRGRWDGRTCSRSEHSTSYLLTIGSRMDDG